MKQSRNLVLMAAHAAMLGSLLAWTPALRAQDVDDAMLLHPPADSWPGYHGDYTGRRHSPLTQITPQNVGGLSLAWAFQTNQTAEIKSSPIMVDGVLYFTVPDNVWAVDARTGHQLWRYTYPPNHGEHIGQRGVAVYKGWVYTVSPDAHLVCLDARTGKVRWIVELEDSKKGYWATGAPLIVKGHVIIGVGGDLDNLPMYLFAIDPETGQKQWTFDVDPKPGPGVTTGGTTWITGTFDPELNLLYWGTGNPTPVLAGDARPGDDLYTCSIVALNPDTGKLVWAFQPSPHDTHDWDAVEIPVLVDGTVAGKPRKLLLQASRNGYFFVLDRVNGKNVLTTTFAPANWASGLDSKGQPIPAKEKEPAPDGRLVAPDEGGATNYRSPSFDPKTGLFIVSAAPAYSLYFNKPADGDYGWAGADYGLWNKGVLEAIDYQTGKIRWSHELGPHGAGSGVLTTASGVTVSGDAAGNFLALDTATGKTLWHAGSGARIGSSPTTYELDGRQFIVTSGGSVMFAWALPESDVPAKHSNAR